MTGRKEAEHPERVGELRRCHLSLVVPMAIEDLRRRGGPTEADHERGRRLADELAGPRGTRLLFGGPPGEPARLVSELARALAALAFVPGGVRFAGLTWEAGADAQAG